MPSPVLKSFQAFTDCRSAPRETVTGTKVDVNKLRQKIGIVFQSYNLFPHMTVLQNVTLAPRKALGISRDKAQAHARALLRQIEEPEEVDVLRP